LQDNFDFNPKINKRSERIIQHKSTITSDENVESSSYGGDTSMFQRDRFLELYDEGMKKKLRQQKLSLISIE